MIILCTSRRQQTVTSKRKEHKLSNENQAAVKIKLLETTPVITKAIMIILCYCHEVTSGLRKKIPKSN